MKRKQIVDISIALCLILIGILLLVLPLFKVTNINYLSIIVFGFYTILNAIQFILTIDSKDYEGLYSAIASLIVLLATIFIKESTPRFLALELMTWITLMALAKLKKMDYYHDRRDRMWKLRVFNLVFFVLAGLLTSINLSYSSEVQIIVLGFFMLIHGMLEIFDPIVKTLIAHS
ncbi:MAG TPA: hypothetical protein DCE23_00910 [Firmicutes bacterium]|nr:hypothetical protein [Bacillota bacterium]